MPTSPLNTNDYRAIQLLRRGALVRVGNAWRYGATEVGDSVVDRLKAHGRVTHLFPGGRGECVILLVERGL